MSFTKCLENITDGFILLHSGPIATTPASTYKYGESDGYSDGDIGGGRKVPNNCCSHILNIETFTNGYCYCVEKMFDDG